MVPPEKDDTQSVHSESDNEAITQNLDDEFEKIVPSKIDEIDSIELTEEDQEIAEILGGNENLENPEIFDVVDDATNNINIADAGATVESEEIEKKIESDTLETEKIDIKQEEEKEVKSVDENSANLDNDAVVKSDDEKYNAATSSEINSENIKGTENEGSNSKETIIDEELLPRETILNIIAESTAEKPVIPLQTYLWEDVKRAKERVSNDQVCVFHMCTVPISKLRH